MNEGCQFLNHKHMIKKLLMLSMTLLFSGSLVAQISGRVTDASDGSFLPGVTVTQKGTTNGTSTDFEGNYTINAPKGSVLVFSFVGYENEEVSIGNQSVVDISLISRDELLEEVVVVGYGSQKKESVVGSIGQTSGEEIKARMAGSDVTNSLTGMVPGLVTVRSTGVPGGSNGQSEATRIFIRGQSTWNGGQPLILVDGVERQMADVDPNDIEKISVLKDASATAVFGVRGANGVILITTKKGAVGKPQLSFESMVSSSSISRIYPVLGSYDALTLKNYAIINSLPVNPSGWGDYMPDQLRNYYRTGEYPELFPNVNWQDEMTNPSAISHKQSVNVTGGTEFVRYFASLNYLYEGDILKTENVGQGYDPNFDYSRYNFRSNLDFKITKTTNFTVNFGGYHGVQRFPNGDRWNFWKGVYGRPPDLYPIKYSDGVYADNALFDRYRNSYNKLNFGGQDRESRSEVNTDFILTQDLPFLLKGLSVSARLSYDNRFVTNGPNINDGGTLVKYIDPFLVINELRPGMTGEELQALYEKYTLYETPDEFNNNSSGYEYADLPNTAGGESVNSNVYRSLFYQASADYNNSFGKHSVTGLALFNRQKRATGSVFPSYLEQWVGRTTYNYDNKYFVEFNGAYNGSEKFAAKYRFGFFPSVAVGWNLANERFLKEKLPQISNFKIRYSDGLIGNDEGIARWLYIGSWNVGAVGNGNNSWLFGAPAINNGPTYRSEGTIPNPDIRWETARKQNIALDLGLFNNKIEITTELYQERRKDIFLSGGQRVVPLFFGAPPVGVNKGSTENRGLEFLAKYTKSSGAFNYYVTVNYAHALDQVVFREDPELAPAYQRQAGFQIGQTRSYINQPGLIQTWDQLYTGVLGMDNTQRLPGQFRQVDFNSDGVVNNLDIVPFGYPNRPQNSYGMILGGQYKGISLMLQFYGVYNVTDEFSYNEFNQRYTIAFPVQQNDAWIPEEGRTTTATFPGLTYDFGDPNGNYWQTDRSYFRLQNAEVAYNIPKSISKLINAKNANISLGGNNLWFWSKMLEDRDAVLGDGNQAYPTMRRLNLRLRVTF